MKKRMGKFTISNAFLYAGEESFDFFTLQHIMDGAVVYHMTSDLSTDTSTYYAYHPKFDLVPYGTMAPEYEPIITHDGTSEIYDLEWRRKEC